MPVGEGRWHGDKEGVRRLGFVGGAQVTGGDCRMHEHVELGFDDVNLAWLMVSMACWLTSTPMTFFLREANSVAVGRPM